MSISLLNQIPNHKILHSIKGKHLQTTKMQVKSEQSLKVINNSHQLFAKKFLSELELGNDFQTMPSGEHVIQKNRASPWAMGNIYVKFQVPRSNIF